MGLSGWVLASLAVVESLGIADVKLYFILATVGFILAMEYSEPAQHRPVWHTRLRWVTLVLIGGFGYIVLTWVEDVVGISIGPL
jgi:hypothetical protein